MRVTEKFRVRQWDAVGLAVLKNKSLEKLYHLKTQGKAQSQFSLVDAKGRC